MKKHYYIIDGVSTNMIQSNLRNFNDNAKILGEINDVYKIRISLNIVESILARIQLIVYNIKYSCRLKMYKLKGQRFRV